MPKKEGKMKFFIPQAKDKKHAEKVFQGIKKFLKEQGLDLTDRRIFSLTYSHSKKRYHSEVGQRDDRVNEEVIAILESFCPVSGMYLVCTYNRGVLGGEPVLVGKEEVREIIDFEK